MIGDLEHPSITFLNSAWPKKIKFSRKAVKQNITNFGNYKFCKNIYFDVIMIKSSQIEFLNFCFEHREREREL